MGKFYEKKRLFYSVILVLILLVLGVGAVFSSYQKKTLHMERLSAFMLSSEIYEEGMQRLSEDAYAEHYPGLDTGRVQKALVFTAQDGTAREFAVFEAADLSYGDEITQILQRYLHEKIDRYELQNKEEYERLRSFIIRRTRNYVILIVGDDTGSANQLLDQYFEETGYDKTR